MATADPPFLFLLLPSLHTLEVIVVFGRRQVDVG